MRLFTEEQIVDLVYGKSEEGELVHREFDEIVRQYLIYSGVVRMYDDGLYYKIEWAEFGEDLDEVDPWEQDAPEVEPVGEVVIRSAFIPKGETKRVLVTPSDNDLLYDKPNEWGHLLETALQEAAS